MILGGMKWVDGGILTFFKDNILRQVYTVRNLTLRARFVQVILSHFITTYKHNTKVLWPFIFLQFIVSFDFALNASRIIYGHFLAKRQNDLGQPKIFSISLFLFCSPEAITFPPQPTSDCHRYVAIADREKGKWQKSQREKAKDCDHYYSQEETP